LFQVKESLEQNCGASHIYSVPELVLKNILFNEERTL